TYAKGWDDVQLAIILFVLFIIPAIYVTRGLDTLTFGDDIAAGLGLNVRSVRFAALIIGVAISTAAVSLVGTIGFIGLVALHIASRLLGFHHLTLLILSCLHVCLLLVAADLIRRVFIAK